MSGRDLYVGKQLRWLGRLERPWRRRGWRKASCCQGARFACSFIADFRSNKTLTSPAQPTPFERLKISSSRQALPSEVEAP